MRFVGIIPARLAATRFPRKPMAMICNMPMVGHCYHRARLALGQENVYVATCDSEISSYIETINGKSIITSNSPPASSIADIIVSLWKASNK